jgi:hypothetical protein
MSMRLSRVLVTLSLSFFALDVKAQPLFLNCSSWPVTEDAACVYAYFGYSSGTRLLIDGKPADSPIRASRRELCFRLTPGVHQITTERSPIEQCRLTVVRIERTQSNQVLRSGEVVPVTWRVTGTSDPIWLVLINRSPEVATLEGGEVQKVRTSSSESSFGMPGRTEVTRLLTGLRGSGTVRLEARLSAEHHLLREDLLAQSFRDALRSAAARFEIAASQLPTAAGGRLYRKEDLAHLIEETGADLYRGLPIPEFGAFRDFLDNYLIQIQRTLEEIPASAENSFFEIKNVAFKAGSSVHVEKVRGKHLLDLFRKLFALADGPVMRSLCVQSAPEDQATVRIFPRSFPSDEKWTATRSLLRLKVGKYRYMVSKRGFKTVESSLDLVWETQRVLDCSLVRSQKQGEAAPCRLLSDSEACRWHD